jgi:hypothetical protein
MTRRRGVAELLLFLGASGIGIFAFGRGLAGFFGQPHADPWWLPVGFAALWVLAKQMSRIHLDAYTAAAAIVILAGIITLILALANPVR